MHEEQFAEHGGSPGIRDPGMLESALSRPRNLFAHTEVTLGDLAAAYNSASRKITLSLMGTKGQGFLRCTRFCAGTEGN